jgi:hypothetical protein
MTGSGGGDHLGLVRHQLTAPRCYEGGRSRQGHARGGSPTGVLERTEEGAKELPTGQPTSTGSAQLVGLEVRGEERVGQLSRPDRLGHDPSLGGRGLSGLLGRDLLQGHIETSLPEQLPLQRPGGLGDHGILGEEGEERRVAGGDLREDQRDAVEALECLGALGPGDGLVSPNPSSLLASQQCDDLELRAHGGQHGSSLDGSLDLAHRAGEHRHDAVLVAASVTSLTGRRSTASGRSALAPSNHALLLTPCRPSAGARQPQRSSVVATTDVEHSGRSHRWTRLTTWAGC